MKSLIILSALVLSTNVMAFEDKCYKAAENAAFSYAKADDAEIATLADFRDIYSSDFVEVSPENGWSREFWAFYNISAIINVEVHAVKGKCFVKKVDLSQNDQDEE